MSKYDISGVHVYNKFLWDQLKAEGLLNDYDYNGLVPIIPTQQVPTFNDMAAGKPFIVYTYLINSIDPDLWANVEQVTYMIYSDDEHKLRQITNFLVDISKRYDWTADDVNNWLTGFDSTDGDEYKFEFKWVHVVGGTSPEPFNQEGGRQNANVSVRMCFIRDSNPAVTGPKLGMRA